MSKALIFLGNRLAVLAGFLCVGWIFLGAYDLWFDVRTVTIDQFVGIIAMAFGLIILAFILCVIGDELKK